MKSRGVIAVIVALIGLCATLGGALMSNWDKIFLAAPRPTSIVVTPSQPVKPGSIRPTNTPSLPGTTGCVVTINNPLVSLMSEPDPFSRELIRVKPGDYSTVNEQQGWFQIEAEGRTGWIRNNTWTIANKTSACP